ncbi:MAG: LytTR family DNA-binding domain-containing protein [Candidatus Neomarinimicrobiota bacterium]
MKKPYKALIIDDERLARKDLRDLLSEINEIEIVGEADSVVSAQEAIQKLRPDVIFLDIQMPGESGFDLLEKIDAELKIIFVTAYDEFAIRAFDVNALDYLLKPVNPVRLKTAIERIDLQDEFQVAGTRKLNYNDHLFLMVNSQFKFLGIKNILYINSAGDYSEILTISGVKGLTQKSMKEWETRLPENHFTRIHRSTIINLDYIDHLEEWFNYSYRVYLKGIEEPFVMSRRYVAKLKNLLG